MTIAPPALGSDDALDRLLNALADATRRQVLNTIPRAPSSAALLAELRIPAHRLARDLSLLTGCELVERRRTGRSNSLTVSRAPMALAAVWLHPFRDPSFIGPLQLKSSAFHRSLFYKTVANRRARELLRLIHNEGRTHQTYMRQATGMAQGALSRHLARLRAAELIRFQWVDGVQQLSIDLAAIEARWALFKAYHRAEGEADASLTSSSQVGEPSRIAVSVIDPAQHRNGQGVGSRAP